MTAQLVGPGGSTATAGAWGYLLAVGESVTIDEGKFWLVIESAQIDGHLVLDGRMVEVD